MASGTSFGSAPEIFATDFTWAESAKFLKEQGRVADVPSDFGKFVTDEYVKAAMAMN